MRPYSLPLGRARICREENSFPILICLRNLICEKVFDRIFLSIFRGNFMIAIVHHCVVLQLLFIGHRIVEIVTFLHLCSIYMSSIAAAEVNSSHNQR